MEGKHHSSADEECINFVPFRVGARAIFVGSSGSGKTHFIASAIKEREVFFEVPPPHVVFCTHSGSRDLSSAQLTAARRSDGRPLVEFINDVPAEDREFEPNTLLIFDDLMSDVDGERYMAKILPYYLRRAHHEQLYCFLTVQTLYSRVKFFSTISENLNYLVMFRSPRSLQQIRHFATQIVGAGNSRDIVEIYREVMRRGGPYAYLYFAFHPHHDERAQYGTNLFEETGEPCTIYQQVTA